MTQAERAQKLGKLPIHRQAQTATCTYRIDFPVLGTSVTAEFFLHDVPHDLVLQAWKSDFFPKNLPPFRIIAARQSRRPDFSIFATSKDRYRLFIRLIVDGQVFTYTAPTHEFSEDLFKIVLRVVAAKSALRNLIFLHASALVTERGCGVLIPGPSGTGKSTTALWWMASGRSVLASDTTIVSASAIHAGNSRLSIKRRTAERFIRGGIPSPSYEHGEYLLFDTPAHNLPVPITGIAFVKVTDEDRVREVPISSRRASMKLYEDAHWLVTGGFLLGGQRQPAPPLTDYRILQSVSRIVCRLAAGKLYWLEGGAGAIGEWLSNHL